MSSSIDDLISPISPMGDNADVKTALDEFAQNGYSLKTPSNGNHITSYTFFDVDNDKSDEAIAFYEPSDNLGTIEMAVIKKNDDIWKVVENIKGIGKDVFSIDFADVNGDSRKEIIVCWDVISNSSSHELCVYETAGKAEKLKLIVIGESVSINNYIAVDMNNDSVNEVLAFKLGSGSSSYAGAELLSFASGKIRVLGETKLDAHISTYSDLNVEKIDGSSRVYADAVSSSGSSMLTELIYWSDAYGTIISPFYSYSSATTKDTARNAMVSCFDINSDGLIEIPNDKKLSDLPGEVSCINWKVYKKSTLIHTDYSLLAENDDYTMIIPDKYIDKIKVTYDSKTRKMTVTDKETKKEVFSIIPVLKATFNEEDYTDYTEILDKSGYYYLAKVGNDTKIKISLDDIKNNIKTI